MLPMQLVVCQAPEHISDVIKYGPATPNGANEGVEGYCSGANTLYTSYHVCDVAGNCIDGHWSWTTKP